MKHYISLFIVMVLASSTASYTRAADFRMAFVTDYTFYESGLASVNKKITMTNLTTNNYPEEYFLELPSDSESVVAFDDGGKTQTSIVEENGQKRAKIVLNQDTIGFGNSVTIALSYETMTLTNKNGSRWSIAIPGFTTGEELDGYTVTVTFPDSWSTPDRVIPPPDRPYSWTLTERSSVPITLDFSEKITPTPLPVPARSTLIPVAAGLSIGIVGFVILFELLKRTV